MAETDHDIRAARSPVSDDRQWWPDELLDEVMPPGKSSPTDWIIGPAGDVYAIGDPDPEADDGGVLKRMRPGDVARFSYCDRLGDVEVTFAADGTFTARTAARGRQLVPHRLRPGHPPRRLAGAGPMDRRRVPGAARRADRAVRPLGARGSRLQARDRRRGPQAAFCLHPAEREELSRCMSR